MISFKEFSEEVRTLVQEKRQDVIMELQEVSKVNQKELQLHYIPSADKQITPSLNMSCYYNDYLNGASMENVVNEMICTIERSEKEIINFAGEEMKSMILDFGKVKEKIVFELINYDKNQELLKTIPSCKIYDLAVVFRILVEEYDAKENATASILVTNYMLELWGEYSKEIYSIALENTMKKFEFKFFALDDLLFNVVENGESFNYNEIENNNIHVAKNNMMYVLTNKKNLWGAGTLVYSNLINEISEYFKESLYIIPCSIHELIIIPSRGEIDEKELDEMIRDVNRTTVLEEDFLSNHVYYYDFEKHLMMN